MREAIEQFIAERLSNPKFRSQLPCRPAQSVVRPESAIPGAIARQLRDRAGGRLQPAPQRQGAMRIVDREPAELSGDIPDAGSRMGEIDVAPAGRGIDDLAMRIVRAKTRRESEPAVIVIDRLIQETAAVTNDGDGEAVTPRLE